ncbi:MAG TPA: hypothetical protein DCO75_08290 [Fibrobacteres bacterium]|jgi:hypothetical protein|nr:hypothetical protein [Fibrobacterota bacterium]
MNKKIAYLILTVAFSVFIFCTNENSALVRNNQYDAGGIAGDSSITVTAMKDTVVAINDSFFIHATGTNVNGTVKRYFWALDGKNYDSITDGGRIKTAFATSGVKLVLVKASNDSGVASLKVDTVKITVHSYAPVVVAMKDTTISVNDSLLIQATGFDTNGIIKKYFWALYGKNYSDSTDSGMIKIAYTDTGTKKIFIKVRDDDSIFSPQDTCVIKVTASYVPALYIPELNGTGDGLQTFDGYIVNDSLYYVVTQKMIAYGGGPLSSYTWSVSSLSYLPAGTTFDPLTGTFHAQGGKILEGEHTFNMTVSDGSSTANGGFIFIVKSYSGTCPFPDFQQPQGVHQLELPDAYSSYKYGAGLQAFGDGKLPWSWYLKSGSLPEGMVIDQANGILRGKPYTSTAGKTFTFTVNVIDSSGIAASTDSLVYKIKVSK